MGAVPSCLERVRPQLGWPPPWSATPIPPAANDSPVGLGESNSASASTVINTTGGNGLNGVTTSDETYACGLLGESQYGTGVYGTQSSTSDLRGSDGNPDTAAVLGDSGAGVGVLGLSSTTNGVQGGTSADGGCGVYGLDASSEGGYGLYGISKVGGLGVYGTSAQSAGVVGSGATVGVQGDDAFGGTCIGVSASLRDSSNPSPALQAETVGTGSAVEASIDNPSNSSPALSATTNGTGPAMLASNSGGTALAVDGGLQVEGAATFSRSGRATIKAAKTTVTVTGVALTAASLVLANLQNSLPGVFVEAVVPKVSGSSFEILLSQAVPTGKTAKIGWFVVN